MLITPSARRAGEQGYALIEAVIAASLALVIFSATLAMLESGTRSESRDQQWALAIQSGQAGLSRMVHEVRSAYSVLATTPNSISFLAWVGGSPAQVYYACDVPQPGTVYNECVRLQAAVNTQLPAISTGVPIVIRVLNGTLADPVFYFTPSPFAPNYVEAKIELPARGELAATGSSYQHRTVLDSGAYLRNLDLGA